MSTFQGDEAQIRRTIAALRSGQYTQGQGALIKQEEGMQPLYCCLGVMIAVDPEWDFEQNRSAIVRENSSDYEVLASDYAHRVFGNWRMTRGPHVTIAVERSYGTTEDEYSLVYLNDSFGHPEHKTFPEIADYLETWLNEQLQEGSDGTTG